MQRFPGGRWARALVIAGFALIAGACAYTPYRPTLEQYRQIGNGAELRGDLAAAERAYTQALETVREGQLGDQLEVVSLYELARSKRQMGKLLEAERLLNRALEVDDKLLRAYGRNERGATGNILAELAATYLATGRVADGAAMLRKLAPIAAEYQGLERSFIKQVFSRYARALADRGEETDARRFAAVADSL